jgi:hypothetical protein
MVDTVWSYGGGVQSVALAVLVARGELPRPARVVMADTGREASATWRYTDDVVRELLAPTLIETAGHDLARVDLRDRSGRILIPAYTARDGDGRLPAYCSAEWKRDVIARWLRAAGYGPRRPVRLWLGISVDELHRAKPSRLAWIDHRFPLLFDRPMTRAEGLLLIESAGLARPLRSSCWMCPYRSDAEWSELDPADWQAALALEADMRQVDPTLTLHRSGVPLADIQLAGTDRPGLWDLDACATGYCMT